MNTVQKSFVQIHIAVLLWGFTAVLGKLITLSTLQLVWWRVLLTSISLSFLLKKFSRIKKVDKQTKIRIIGIGFLVGLHWLCFYGSVKLSNSSIAVVCMATVSLMTSIIEPLFFKKKIQWKEILLGLMILPGMLLIVNTNLNWISGIVVGLIGALLAAIFSVLNKKAVTTADPLSVTYLEINGVLILTTLILPFYYYFFPIEQFIPGGKDFVFLLVLALACTSLPFLLSMMSLRHISTFSSNFILNLEPVYGILLAWLILNENKELSPQFYWGVLLIMGVVFGYSFLTRNRNSLK
jgi:drug/metabolite transporter (DMT)-like permease